MNRLAKTITDLAGQDLPSEDRLDLAQQADLAMSRKARLGILLYPAACVLLGLSSGYFGEHPVLVGSLTLTSVIVAGMRAYLAWRFAELYRHRRRLYRSCFAAGILLATVSWSLLSSLAVVLYGLGWLSFLGLLMTVAMTAMAIVVYAANLPLVQGLAAAMLAPHAVAGLLTGGREGLLLSAAAVVFLVYTWTVGRRFHTELWRGLVNAKLLEKHARELDDARIRAEAVRDSHGEFLATLSHEIRTPLGGILGMSELLSTSDDPEEWRRHSKVIQTTADGLLSLIDSILDFSKIEAAKLRLEATDFSLRRIINEVIELHAPRAAQRGIELESDLAADLPDWLVGDALRLRQVLTNLVGNAIKFTPEGSVVLRARSEIRSNRPWLHFAVEDTGVGIEKDAQQKLFSAFVQGDGSISRRFGGTGLGLAICLRIVELQEGEIGFDSTPGAGSTFWFRIPCTLSRLPPQERLREQRLQPSSAEIRLRRRQDCRILLVEDNEVNRIVALQLLGQLDMRADAVVDGCEALEAMEDQVYDLVLMDCEMPRLDGWEATRRIRRREIGTRHTPIVAMTAHAMAGDREKCLAAGMDDYLPKPFRREDLVAVLDRSLQRLGDVIAVEGEEAEGRQRDNEFSGGPGELDPERIECLRQLNNDEVDVFNHVGQIFLERAHPLLEQLQEGLVEGDSEKVRLGAHSLYGSSSNVGAQRMSGLCRELELLALQDAVLDYPEKIDDLKDEFRAVAQTLSTILDETRGAAGAR